MALKKLTLPTLIIMALFIAGCASSGNKKATDEFAAGAEGLDLELNADSDSGKTGPIRTVFFDYNSAQLTEQAKQTLDTNAEFLKQYSAVEIQVEGHCDERGGVQYNLALGEKRAQSVKKYLVSMGIESGRISTISFGKERPLAFGHDDMAWSQNRRGNFVITAK